MRRDSGQIFLNVKLRLIMYSLTLPCSPVSLKKSNNLANVVPYTSLLYYFVFKGMLFINTMEHYVSHGRRRNYILVTYPSWKVPLSL